MSRHGHPSPFDRRQRNAGCLRAEGASLASPCGSVRSGRSDGGFGCPVLYLLGEMPEELARWVDASDGHVAVTDRWHEVALTKPMFLLKLGTPRGERTRASSVGSVPGRGEAGSRRLGEPDGSDGTRQQDASRLADQSRAQAPVPGGARAPR